MYLRTILLVLLGSVFARCYVIYGQQPHEFDWEATNYDLLPMQNHHQVILDQAWDAYGGLTDYFGDYDPYGEFKEMFTRAYDEDINEINRIVDYLLRY